MSKNQILDKWNYGNTRSIIMDNDDFIAIFLPNLGGLLWKLIYKKTWTNILYNYRDPSLYGKMISSYSKLDPQHDYFMGGWFEALPVAGYGFKGTAFSPQFDLHGETTYRPWKSKIGSDSEFKMEIEILRLPLKLEKTVSFIDHGLKFHEKLENLSNMGFYFSWLHHPCFDLPSFDGSIIEISPDNAVIDDKFIHPYRKLKQGYRIKWPLVTDDKGSEIDLSKIIYYPSENTNDTIYMRMKEGHFSLNNIKQGFRFSVNWDASIFPFVWYWNANGGGAYPWYGRAKTFSLEISTSMPGTGLDEQIENGTAKFMDPAGEIETEILFQFQD